MKKLDREQAAWLIEQLDMYHVHTDCSFICGACEIKYGEVKNVINQCTEKEFPKLEVADVFVEMDERNDELISISFTNTPSSDACWALTQDEFKKFTAGCQAICEWLSEQE